MELSRQPRAQERLRQAIDREQHRLRSALPGGRAAIVALIRVLDRLPSALGHEMLPDLVTGRHFAALGANKAFLLCLESTGGAARNSCPGLGDGSWLQPTEAIIRADTRREGWAEGFLADCRRLAEAELVLAHCETGFMRLVDDGDGTFDAWIATKRVPTIWRERADIDWWAGWLARRHEPELRSLLAERTHGVSGEVGSDAFYQRIASVHLALMAYQLSYPPEAEIDGCPIRTYRDVLARLIAWALRTHDRGEAVVPRSEQELVAALATDLTADPAVISRAVAAFTLDAENAAYHAAVAGVAAAPLVRMDRERLVWSVHGLMTEPLLFLTRELRRRAAQEYHNTAYLREMVFRQDLYALFVDKRFVTSAGRIALRREAGDVRTDIDAVVFDRKSGTLGLFELKSQDPFARSTAELMRQRDNLLYANRQISGVLAWLQRHGANEILDRVDHRTAKTFRVQKVYPFVLGRYLVHFNDGPEPDRRAAWGTWPQVLRLLDAQPIRPSEANPLASLFKRLKKDVSPGSLPASDGLRELRLGDVRLIVHPSYAAFQAMSTRSEGSRVRRNE